MGVTLTDEEQAEALEALTEVRSLLEVNQTKLNWARDELVARYERAETVVRRGVGLTIETLPGFLDAVYDLCEVCLQGREKPSDLPDPISPEEGHLNLVSAWLDHDVVDDES